MKPSIFQRSDRVAIHSPPEVISDDYEENGEGL